MLSWEHSHPRISILFPGTIWRMTWIFMTLLNYSFLCWINLYTDKLHTGSYKCLEPLKITASSCESDFQRNTCSYNWFYFLIIHCFADFFFLYLRSKTNHLYQDKRPWGTFCSSSRYMLGEKQLKTVTHLISYFNKILRIVFNRISISGLEL